MLDSKGSIIQFATIILVIYTFISIVPNLSNNLENYSKSEGSLRKASIHESEYTGRYFTKKVRTTLILRLDNGVNITLNDQYDAYWNIFLDRRSIGKKLTYYVRNNQINQHLDPVQIELDDRIIYDPSQARVGDYFLILMTIAGVIYSSNKYFASGKWKKIRYKSTSKTTHQVLTRLAAMGVLVLY